MKAIIRDDKTLLTGCLGLYNNWVAKNVDEPVRKTIRIRPSEIAVIFKEIRELTQKLPNSSIEGVPIPVTVNEHELSLLKRAILHTLHERSIDKEQRSELTNDRVLKDILDEEVKEISDLTNCDWFEKVSAFRTPKLTDFLTLQQAVKNESIAIGERQYDEKFHILNAPTLFWDDIRYYRSACSLRSRSVSVAYLDIDDFKKFNSDHGETKVDRDVLPKFMSELEAHVFSHGHAYRFGGDEYAVLLSNMSYDQACELFAGFQTQLGKMDYFEIDEGPSVSIGVMEISDECILTDKECLTMAEQAKGKAKEENKGSIFINTGSRIGEDSFEEYVKTT